MFENSNCIILYYSSVDEFICIAQKLYHSTVFQQMNLLYCSKHYHFLPAAARVAGLEVATTAPFAGTAFGFFARGGGTTSLGG